MIAIVHSIYSQSVHAPARDAELMDNDHTMAPINVRTLMQTRHKHACRNLCPSVAQLVAVLVQVQVEQIRFTVSLIWFTSSHNNNNNNNNMYLKSSIQTSSIDYIKENIHITLNISNNIPIQ